MYTLHQCEQFNYLAAALSKWFDEKFIYWAYPKRSLYLLLWRQRGLVVTSLGVSTKLLNVGTG